MYKFSKQWEKLIHLIRKNIYLLVGSLVVLVVYSIELLSKPYGLHFGDADFFFAMGEAFRIDVLHYHQFPWLNPWIAGGVPLYADPQFGLFSIQSLLVLIFGGVLGWKIAMIFYLLMGYFGFYKLTESVFKTPKSYAVILALTWSFADIWIVRSTGHFTFFLFSFLPWILYVFWNRASIRWPALKLGLLCGLLVNSSPHNSSVMIISILGFAIFYEVFFTKKKDRVNYIRYLAIFTATFLPLAAHKLFFSYKYASTLSAVRATDPEEFPGWGNIYQAIFGYNTQPGLLPSGWGKGEATVGIGIGPLLVFLLAVSFIILFIYKRRQWGKINKYLGTHVGPKKFVLFSVILFFTGLLLSFGDFVGFSPYSLLREMPIFNNTRVAVRWLIPSVFAFLLIISSIKFEKKYIPFVYSILLINVLMLILTVGHAHNAYSIPNDTSGYNDSLFSGPPKQIERWFAPRTAALKDDDNLYSAVANNIDQTRTNLVPFFDTKYGETQRCSEANNACKFVRSNNAQVLYWSPNKIRLKLTSPGPVDLNMNPSRYWLQDGNKYLFTQGVFTKPAERFVIYPSSGQTTVTLEYAPPLTPAWMKNKLK